MASLSYIRRTRPGDREADMGFLCDRGSLLYLDVLVFSGYALVSFAVIFSDPDSCQDITSRNCADWSSAVWHRHFCRTVCTDGMGAGLLQVFYSTQNALFFGFLFIAWGMYSADRQNAAVVPLRKKVFCREYTRCCRQLVR